MRFAAVAAFITIPSAGLCAQSSARAEEPRLRRWFDLQTFTVSSRYRFIRYEQYRRVNNHPASGFALSADRMLPRRARLQAGFATVDQFYGGWNADRIQSGRHVFALLAVPIAGPLSAQLFGTQALSSGYPIPNQKRYEAVIACDILILLKRTNVF